MGARILVGVAGGIAAYKACALVSKLVQRGDTVDVILTPDAERFVAPLTFAALTRREVWTSLWQAPAEIPHIALVRAADIFIICPATAQTMAKLALGLADDLLTNAALAARIPLLVAPAMNSAMYEHPATQAHLDTLRSRGVRIIEPGAGFLAEREFGIGRLADEERILAAIDDALMQRKSLVGCTLLITAGPTREAVDPVRFLSNAATGATGIILAQIAAERGAVVRLVLGPTHLAAPAGVEVRRVTNAQEMAAAALAPANGGFDCIIATAAVADERPVTPAEHKIKKHAAPLHEILVEPTVDIIRALRTAYPGAYCVGFAAETQAHAALAAEKRQAKQLDAIVWNDVAAGAGFGAVENTWHLQTDSGETLMPQATKGQLAASLLTFLEPHILARRATEAKALSPEPVSNE